MSNTITLTELRAKLDRGDPVTLVEALPATYYEREHLPEAINIPHDAVDELAPNLLPDRNAEIVVYCANGPCQNSGLAARRLTRLGYTNVRDYHEGKAEWIEAGLPTESHPRRVASHGGGLHSAVLSPRAWQGAEPCRALESLFFLTRCGRGAQTLRRRRCGRFVTKAATGHVDLQPLWKVRDGGCRWTCPFAAAVEDS